MNLKILVDEATADNVHEDSPYYFTCYVGPIWNDGEAAQKANNWLANNGLSGLYQFTGSWNTPPSDFNQNSLATFKRL
jgi:hypothetical protein